MAQKELGHGLQLVVVLHQDGAAALVGLVDQAADLVVDLAGGFLGIGLGAAVAHADEDLAVIAVADGAEGVGHAVAGDHIMGDFGGLLNIG